MAALLVSLVALSAFSAPATTPARPPNIVFILADDLGYGDLGCYGQKRYATPHIDALARSGMRFTQHYSGAPVCASSRSALMTGLHTGHTPIRGNKEIMPEGQEPLPADTLTLPRLLQRAGYVTGAFGKWGLGYPGSVGEPTRQGFDHFYGYNCQRLGHHYYPDHLWQDTTKIVLEDNAGTMKAAYGPELIHQKSLAFIERNKDRPFFMFVPNIMPHAELAVPERYLARHRGKYGPETPYVGTDNGPQYRQGPYASQREPRATFAAMMNLLDDQVGEIVAKLKELGLDKNTLVVFSSDNGPHDEGGHDPKTFASSGPFRGMKRDTYEGGIRVPFIAAWPGTIAPGATSDHISAFWDLLPTFGELAGAPIPTGLDGISLAPTLLGRGQQKQHEYLYWEFHEKGGRVGLRMGDWKAVRYNVAKNPLPALELYNLAKDPSETKNVAAANPEIVARIEALLRGARTESPIFKFQQSGFLQKK
ncbi:MAG: arylsulfatase [Verrucomicrobiota bacterium]